MHEEGGRIPESKEKEKRHKDVFMQKINNQVQRNIKKNSYQGSQSRIAGLGNFDKRVKLNHKKNKFGKTNIHEACSE